MTVVQKFKYEWPDGVTPIEFIDWIRTLPELEQDEFFAAKRRQEDYRLDAINNGRLQLEHGTYVWKDQKEAKLNKQSDPVWVKFFQRYLAETHTKFSVIFEEADDQ